MSESLAKLLQQHTCLYASFNSSIDADVARGDGTATMNSDVARLDPTAGRFGGGLVFSAQDHGWAEDEFTFAARDNSPYRTTEFEGTVSMWLRGDPDADLNDQFPVDPFHISRHPADGSFYLDLTRPNDWRYGSPRKLRFGLYGDSPAQDMFVGGELLVVGDLGWNDGEWHHLVATFGNVNSGREDGSASLYIDGALRATMDGYAHQLSWETESMKIGLGQRYAGAIDEFLILDTRLHAESVAELYGRDEPAGASL
jgi:hypothetical protein